MNKINITNNKNKNEYLRVTSPAACACTGCGSGCLGCILFATAVNAYFSPSATASINRTTNGN